MVGLEIGHWPWPHTTPARGAFKAPLNRPRIGISGISPHQECCRVKPGRTCPRCWQRNLSVTTIWWKRDQTHFMATQPNIRPKLSSQHSLLHHDGFAPDKATLGVEMDKTEVNWRAIALVAAGIVLTSAGHYLTPSSLLAWHGVFQRFYYLTVVFSAISFGWVGGLVAALAAGVAYIPH